MKKVDLKESLRSQLGKAVRVFCKDVLSILNDVVAAVLLNAIKGEIKDEVDKLCADNLKFEFISDTMPESVSVAILQNVVDVMVVQGLRVNLKGKRDVLDATFSEILKK
eukprot:TRINITY_DN11021_c0_g1_i1.p1 TRINITY_DN11021_c0_g1~~TRINITY_DN11021_c0_g1_i1.p1  ORF type:complete len:109 (-),score=35.06 TRINITY_DN11021_c0_g1_i1:142-468(-)